MNPTTNLFFVFHFNEREHVFIESQLFLSSPNRYKKSNSLNYFLFQSSNKKTTFIFFFVRFDSSPTNWVPAIFDSILFANNKDQRCNATQSDAFKSVQEGLYEEDEQDDHQSSPHDISHWSLNH